MFLRTIQRRVGLRTLQVLSFFVPLLIHPFITHTLHSCWLSTNWSSACTCLSPALNLQKVKNMVLLYAAHNDITTTQSVQQFAEEGSLLHSLPNTIPSSLYSNHKLRQFFSTLSHTLKRTIPQIFFLGLVADGLSHLQTCWNELIGQQCLPDTHILYPLW